MAQTFRMRIERNVKMTSKRNHGRMMKDTYRALGHFHRLRHIPKHFENVPETVPGGPYGYQSRTKVYQLRKAAAVGHTRPNVFTGKLRQSVIQTSDVRATQYKMTFTARGYFPMPDEQRAELEAVSAEEIKDLALEMKLDYERRAYKPENQTKTYKRLL